jgi:hypothetical protein
MTTDKLALYQISAEYLSVLDALIEATNLSEIGDMNAAAKIEETLDEIDATFRDKAVAVAAYARNLQVAAGNIREAMQPMARRCKALENGAASLLEYLRRNMEVTGITRVDDPQLPLALRKNPPAVQVTDDATLPDDVVTVTVTMDRASWILGVGPCAGTVVDINVDKAAVKARIQAGEQIEGAHLVQNTRLQVG